MTSYHMCCHLGRSPGSTALPQITFILHEEEDGWWAEWPYMGYSATAATKEAVMQLCREGVQIITSRPADHYTLVFWDDSDRVAP